jgi:hypothetical protein
VELDMQNNLMALVQLHLVLSMLRALRIALATLVGVALLFSVKIDGPATAFGSALLVESLSMEHVSPVLIPLQLLILLSISVPTKVRYHLLPQASVVVAVISLLSIVTTLLLGVHQPLGLTLMGITEPQ